MDELRIQVPGGWMTSQDLLDLVGWAGAAGSASLRLGDFQDLLLEEPKNDPGQPPQRFVLRPRGSLQSSAYETGQTAWLTTGVWMDLLAEVPDPGTLDVQLAQESTQQQFLRFGHLRLTAKKAPHQWELVVRRPGTTVAVRPEQAAVDTGNLPNLVDRFRREWSRETEALWDGTAARFASSENQVPRHQLREGFHEETPGAFSFGFWTPSARMSVERLRDLAWLARDSGAPRLWLTPSRILLFPGIPKQFRAEWERWTAKNRLVNRHGDLEHAVQAAGFDTSAFAACHEVLEFLNKTDRWPPTGTLLVAGQQLNRDDGVCATPHPVLIRTANSWLFRNAEGNRSGEGSLEESLEAIEARASPADLPEKPRPRRAAIYRCLSCLTVYDPQWGDPRNHMVPGTAYADRPAGWACPVCGGPDSDVAAFEPAAGKQEEQISDSIVDLIT